MKRDGFTTVDYGRLLQDTDHPAAETLRVNAAGNRQSLYFVQLQWYGVIMREFSVLQLDNLHRET